MFRCQKCGNVSEKGESQNSIVVERRNKSYVNKIKVYGDKLSEERVIESEGWEIAREIKVCGKCFEQHLEEQNGTSKE